MLRVDDGAKMAAIRLHARGTEEDDIQEIYRLAGMSRATFYRELLQYKEEGTVHIYKSKKRGRLREYARADITYLKSLDSDTITTIET